MKPVKWATSKAPTAPTAHIPAMSTENEILWLCGWVTAEGLRSPGGEALQIRVEGPWWDSGE